MEVRSIAHKGLRRLYEGNSSKSVSADTVDKLRKILGYIRISQRAQIPYISIFYGLN